MSREIDKNNYQGKVVLDIGAFCGETAVFFHNQGAKKVIIYEPFLSHHKLIRRNICLNNIKADTFEEGIGENNEAKTISYQDADLAFGLSGQGKNQTEIKIRNIADVLIESEADIAKIDCEGAELSLVNVPEEVLQKINYYFIETHSTKIRELIINKFKKSGFILSRKPVELFEGIISMLYFEKKK